MKTILVPHDFSAASDNAAEYAVNLSKVLKYKVVLFHVFHVPVPAANGIPTLMITVDDLQKRNEEHLKKVAHLLKKKTGKDVEYMAKMGLAVDEILEEGKNASLIVMGMKSTSKISEALLGSISTSTLRKAKIPVLVIPENAPYKTPAKIVFACDYDPKTDLQALDGLSNFMKPFDSKIYVVSIKNKINSGSITSAEESTLNQSTIEPTFYFTESEDLVEGINAFVELKKADMVAIIPHQYNFLERLFHKSVSKKMAFHTKVPLLSLPDKQKEDTTFL